MKPDHCLGCQGRDLYFTHMSAESGVTLGTWFFNSVIVTCSVCLTCGLIAPYLDAGDLKKVRAWNAKAKTKAKATVDKR